MTTPNYIRGYNPIWYFVDLNGVQFDDTFYMFVLQNDIPYLPATVYEDNLGNVIWRNPIQCLANGTFPENIFYPNDDSVYRLEFRQGDTQADALVYLVPDYQPSLFVAPEPGGSIISSDNVISNPQFAVLNVPSGTVFSGTSLSVQIAPDWFLSWTGVGSVTVNQLTFPANNNIPTNPSYVLQLVITNTSMTNLSLTQTFNNNSGLWSQGFVSASITGALGTSGTPPEISLLLVPSGTSNITTIFTDTFGTAYSTLTGSTKVNKSTDTTSVASSYLDFVITLPTIGTINLTSIQLVSTDSLGDVDYEQIPIERQIDHLYNYYNLPLQYKPIDSFLVGWDFPLNPAQFAVSSVTAGTNPKYVWDQTIIGTVTNDVTVTADSVTQGLNILTTGDDEGVFLLQYLTGYEVQKLIGQQLSVNVFAYRGSTGGNITCRVNLYTGSNSAVFPDLNTPNFFTIGALTVDIPTKAAIYTKNSTSGQGLNWTEIPRDSFGQASGTLSSATTSTSINNVVDLKFNGWQLTDNTQIAATKKFAIVVAFYIPDSGTTLKVNSISLVPGSIPTRPSIQTQDEALRACQYYYEITGAQVNEQLIDPPPANLTTTTIDLIGRTFGFDYNTIKVSSSPDITLFSAATSTLNRVSAQIYNGGSIAPGGSGDVNTSNWSAIYTGNKSANYAPNNVNTLLSSSSVTNNWAEGFIAYSAIVDARLGLI